MICALACVPGLAAAQTSGRTYYVNSVTGNDANTGLTAGQPLRTLGTATRKLSRAGGDRLVLSGSFRETLALQGINDPTSGPPNAGRWTIVESALDGQGRPTGQIDGAIPSSAASFPYDKRGLSWGFGPGKGNYLNLGVYVSGCNWIQVRNLEIHGVAAQGIFANDTSHLDLEGLIVHWVGESAIELGNSVPGSSEEPSSDLTIENCTIDQCNLGSWVNRATRQGFGLGSQSISLFDWDGFNVVGNHVSNSFMEGIDFAAGARNGVILGNLIENVRAAGIYANEGRDTFIVHNIVRRVGWYDPEDGTGLVLASPYISQKTGLAASESGSIGILLSNGDLGPLASKETGRLSGIWVFENVVSWTRKDGISVINAWRNEGRTGWFVDSNHLFNNVVHRSCQGTGAAAISMDGSSTNSTILNNIVLDSAQNGMFVFDASLFSFFAKNAISNNLYWGNAMNGTLGTMPVLADPRLVTVPTSVAGAANFTLSPGSPAIGAGVPIGFLRPSGGPTDIGAYQTSVPPWHAGGGF